MLATREAAVAADIVGLGKGLGGGLPISACVGRESVMRAWAKGPDEIVHTATFHGAPLACATALATLSVLDSERLPERAHQVGEWWMSSLASICARHRGVRAPRGRGLMIGIEIEGSGRALALSRKLLERGFIVLTGGSKGETLTFTPPLVISRSQLEAFNSAFDETLATLDGRSTASA
ncbi:MAG: aminotransferase class III-fold pyridoxal phosphate-dependent enzyme [Polyangiaceae bacterium]